ncbi:hypothetical protein [Vibrio mediterranei]|uniref:hypothetical protein n=1 Tax=Vibrio mediterranei TaxID=689 RepID=UPI0040692BA6
MKIRVRHNYNTVEMDHNAQVVNGHKSVAGATVSVLQKDGTSTRYQFGGFDDAALYRNSLLEYQLVKVVEVLSFSEDDFAKPLYFENDCYLIGVFDVNIGKVKVLLENGVPIVRPLSPTPFESKTNNVVPIRS